MECMQRVIINSQGQRRWQLQNLIPKRIIFSRDSKYQISKVAEDTKICIGRMDNTRQNESVQNLGTI